MKGIHQTTTHDGVHVFRLHYSADPSKDPSTPEGAEWLQRELVGYPGGLNDPRWRREMEIDFDAFAGQLLFPYLLEYQDVILCEPVSKVPVHWQVTAGLDYGTRNPSAFELTGWDRKTGNPTTFWEYYQAPKTKQEGDEEFRKRKGYLILANAIKSNPFWKHMQDHNVVITADSSLWNKNQETKYGLRSVAYLLEEQGIVMTPATKGKGSDMAWYEMVSSRMWSNPKQPIWRITRNCTWLWKELQGLRFAEHSASASETHNEKDEIVDKANHACFSGDTEILTKDGWKLFADIHGHEQVLTWGEKGKIEYEEPIELVSYPYEGEMYLHESANLNFCVTPNHRMWVADQVSVIRKKRPQFKRLEARELHEVMWVPKCAQRGHDEIDFSDELIAWFGFWLAEGCKSQNYRGSKYAHVDQKNADKETLDMLEKAGQHSTRTDKKGVTRFTYNTFHWNLIKEIGTAEKKYIPTWLKQASQRQLKILIHWMIKGDGTDSGRMWRYNTVSPRLADDFQEICFKAGYVSRITSEPSRQSISPSTGKPMTSRKMYHITIQRGRHGQGGNGETSVLAQIKKSQIKHIDFNDRVYCVTTKNRVVVVRRNGIAMWCGNCDAIKYDHMSHWQQLDQLPDQRSPQDKRIDRMSRRDVDPFERDFGDDSLARYRESARSNDGFSDPDDEPDEEYGEYSQRPESVSLGMRR
ncbi:MAG: hypothetical protein PHV74_14995 [Dehalococcoidia bacterium]|nr:hypothetical protein [Dehalococcoidia bacterium]